MLVPRVFGTRTLEVRSSTSAARRRTPFGAEPRRLLKAATGAQQPETKPTSKPQPRVPNVPQQPHFRKTCALSLLGVPLLHCARGSHEEEGTLKNKPKPKPLNTTLLHSTHNENIQEQTLCPFCCSSQRSSLYQNQPYFIVVFSICQQPAP